MGENMTKKTITVQGEAISVLQSADSDYISLTDMVKKAPDGQTLIKNWLRNKDTILFLGAWEIINNPDFDRDAFQRIQAEAGRNSFILTTKRWLEETRAIGLIATAGRYGGTYGHKDIAFEFGAWLSPEFKLYLIKEFQRLTALENERNSLEWDLNRTVSKLNYRLHTDAVKEKLLPPVQKKQEGFIYASEAEIINKAVYDCTSKEFKDSQPQLKGNMREYSSVEQLLVLANIENLNAEYIREGIPQAERLERLTEVARRQLKALKGYAGEKGLPRTPKKKLPDPV